MARPISYEDWLRQQHDAGRFRTVNGVVWNAPSPGINPFTDLGRFANDTRGWMSGWSTDDLYKMYYGEVAEDGTSASDPNAQKRLDDFYRELEATLTPGSPYHQALVREARGIGGSAAANAGIEGGLADANTAYYGAQAAQMARERMLGLKGQGTGLQINIDQMRQSQNQFDQQMMQQASLAQWQQKQQQNQMFGGAMGGLGGAALGAAVGGPTGMMYGAQAGSQMGAGLSGGYMTPPPPSYPYRRGGNY
jgi:hypothetical protein